MSDSPYKDGDIIQVKNSVERSWLVIYDDSIMAHRILVLRPSHLNGRIRLVTGTAPFDYPDSFKVIGNIYNDLRELGEALSKL